MSDPNENIDKLFRNNLGSYSQEPPAYVWDQVSSVLDKKARRRRRMFFWLFSSIAMVGMAFGVGYYISDSQADRKIADLENTIRRMMVPPSAISSPSTESGDATSHTPQNSSAPGHTGSLSKPKVENTGPVLSRQSSSGNNHGSQNRPLEKKNASSSHLADLFKQNGGNGISSTDNNDLENTGRGNGANDKPLQKSTGEDQRIIYEKVDVQASAFTLLSASRDLNLLRTSFTAVTPVGKTMQPFRRFAIEAWFGPQYVHRNATLRDTSNLYQPAFGMNVDFDEKYRFSYNTGLAFGFSPVRNFSIFAGIQYSTMNFMTTRDMLNIPVGAGIAPEIEQLPVYTSMGKVSGLQFNTDFANNGETPEFSQEDTKNGDTLQAMTQHFATIEIPVTFRYRVGGRFGVTFQAGVSPAFLVTNDVIVMRGGVSSTVGRTEGLKSVTLNGILAVGLDYQVVRGRLSLFADPQVRYGFINWSNNADVSFHPLFFSGNIGLRAWF